MRLSRKWHRNARIFLLAVASLPILESSAVDAGDAASSAALQYWLAFEIVPSLEHNRPVLNATLVDDPKYGYGVPVRAELERFFHGHGGEALARLHRGSQMPNCTWGVDLRKDGPFTPTPYAHKAHQLARLSLLRARWRFEHGRWDDGVDDVIATMVMGRRIGSDKLWATINFGYMIEAMSVTTAAIYLPQMPGTPRERFSSKLAALPALTPMLDVFLHYEKAVDWMVNYINQAKTDGRLVERIEAISSRDDAKRIMETAHDAAGLIKLALATRSLLREYAELTRRGVDDFRKAYKDRIEPQLKNNPIAQIIGPPYEAEFEEQAVGRCRLALLKACIAVLARGKAGLNEHPDPYGNGPFEYAPFNGGFALRSELYGTFMRERVSLDCGRRRK